MVRVVDRGLGPQLGQTKDFKMVFVASPLSTQHLGERANSGWLAIKIVCPNGATCLFVDCCVCELEHSVLSGFKPFVQ
jgi:hypothetical protein